MDNIKAAHDQQIRDMKTEMQANHNQRFDNIQAEMDNQRAEIDNLNAARIPMFIANLLTDFVEKAKRKSKSFSQKGGHVEITKGYQTPWIVDAALSITLEDLQAINVSSKYYDVVQSIGKVSQINSNYSNSEHSTLQAGTQQHMSPRWSLLSC